MRRPLLPMSTVAVVMLPASAAAKGPPGRRYSGFAPWPLSTTAERPGAVWRVLAGRAGWFYATPRTAGMRSRPAVNGVPGSSNSAFGLGGLVD
jgi:hypothetical protein